MDFPGHTVAVWVCPITQWHFEEGKNGQFSILIERSEFTVNTVEEAIEVCQKNYF